MPLADDIWVLGKELPPGGGAVEIIHSGRSRIAPADGSSEAICSVTGTAPADQAIELAIGVHQIKTAPNQKLRILWVGPKLGQVGSNGAGDHRVLFVNGY